MARITDKWKVVDTLKRRAVAAAQEDRVEVAVLAETLRPRAPKVARRAVRERERPMEERREEAPKAKALGAMKKAAWSRLSVVRGCITSAKPGALRWSLAWRGAELAGIGCFVAGQPHTPVVIVASPWRRRGVGTRLLRRLSRTAAREQLELKPWTTGPAADVLCRRVKLPFKRVRG